MTEKRYHGLKKWNELVDGKMDGLSVTYLLLLLLDIWLFFHFIFYYIYL